MRRLLLDVHALLDRVRGRRPVTSFSYDGLTYQFAGHHRRDDIFRRIDQSRGFYEIEILTYIRQVIGPGGSHVIDIGANIGNHTVYIARNCGAKVYAFECNPVAIDLLNRNIQANGCRDQVTVFEYAVATAPEVFLSPGPALNLGMAWTSLSEHSPGSARVRAMKLDDLITSIPDCSLIKIDVERAELDVLHSGRELLQRFRPQIVVEAEGNRFVLVNRFLQSVGYEIAWRSSYDPYVFAFAPREHIDFQSFERS